jgi:DNA (cytosine-5)-methyltransferase 1
MSQQKFMWYEFFAGGGMARVGLGDRWVCTFANEWCPKKAAAYRAHFGPCPELKVEDVAKLTPQDLPAMPDLVWASFPCQDLSLAGNGAGLEGERSGTFKPFWELVKRLLAEGRKARLVVLENVVGAITSHGGKDFAAILRAVSESEYRVGAMVIDAVRFLPQSRPRLFIVAAANGVSIPKGLVSPKPTPWYGSSIVAAHRGLPSSVKDSWVWWKLPEPPRRAVNLSSLIEETPSGTSWHSKEETARLISLMSDVNRKKLWGVQREGRRKVGTLYRRTRAVKAENGTVRKLQRAEVRFDEIAGCLRTPVGGSSRQTILVVEGETVRSRLLSAREAARLMGVPDGYPIPENYNEAYHVFGDGLAVPVVRWLEKHLLRPLVLASMRLETAA